MPGKISRILLAVFFIIAGANHFISPDVYLPLMPECLPWPTALIYLSGAAEMAGGIGMGFPKWRWLAGWWLTAVLVAVFPANIQMLTHHVPINGHTLPLWVLWIRLPLQAVLAAWVYLACVSATRPRLKMFT